MKLIKKKNGSIRITAQSQEDSISLLEFIEQMAGDNDPNRLSVRKRKELEQETKK